MNKKRQARKKKTAEDFTPMWLVKEILDRWPLSRWNNGMTFIDPECGNGNALVYALQRKIDLNSEQTALEALWEVYGVDVMTDNIRECRWRLLQIVKAVEPITKDHLRAVFTNVIRLDYKIYPKGSLEYHFKFTKWYKEGKNKSGGKREADPGVIEAIDCWYDELQKLNPDWKSLPVPSTYIGKKYNPSIFGYVDPSIPDADGRYNPPDYDPGDD